MVFFTELFEIAVDILKWIFKFLFKSFREMSDLCRNWATQAFYQLSLGGAVLQWRLHAGRFKGVSCQESERESELAIGEAG